MSGSPERLVERLAQTSRSVRPDFDSRTGIIRFPRRIGFGLSLDSPEDDLMDSYAGAVGN